ncbi:MAG: response regulator [Gammaproteobacteria bacterium]|nr:response regulator [Gammaproteobacteria bacterium]MDH5650424.1 response regulator [Gammaproteobacteria bacterium]
MPSPLKIMIVDDATSMRNLLKAALLNAGFEEFVEADNGQQALNLLRQEKVHLVICDLDMPKVDGMTVLQAMRNDAALKGIPFIMVSAISSADKVIQVIEEGVNDYIIKPIKPESFVRRVKDVLKEKN